MSRLPPAVEDRRLDDEEEVTSSFGSDDGVHVPVTEGSVSVDRSEDEGEGEGGSSVSDCESVTSGIEQNSFQLKGLVRLEESDKLHDIIGKKFISRLNYVGIDAQVVYIYRNLFIFSSIAQAKVSSFQIFTKSVEKKNGGDAHIKFAWFGGAKDEISNIIVHGFGFDNIKRDANCFGHGIVLSADHSPPESLESATVDEDGIKHILLGRVLLGKSELVNRGSMQCYLSSDDFQSGVDDLLSPKKIIIWSSQMNTHILPKFVISFKTLTSIKGYVISTISFQLAVSIDYTLMLSGLKSDGVPVRVEKPVSPWIPIPDLIAALSKILAPKAMEEIIRFRCSYIEHKICRGDMTKGIREVTGDRLLLWF